MRVLRAAYARWQKRASGDHAVRALQSSKHCVTRKLCVAATGAVYYGVETETAFC